MLTNELFAIEYGIFEDEKLLIVLGELDEAYDSVSSIINERMIFEKITVDDVKALLLTHKSRLDRRRTLVVLPFSSVNVSIKNNVVTEHNDPKLNSHETFSPSSQTCHTGPSPPQTFYPYPCDKTPSFGRGKGRVQCQVCGKLGHIVAT